jgi:hypothetical protein
MSEQRKECNVVVCEVSEEGSLWVQVVSDGKTVVNL